MGHHHHHSHDHHVLNDHGLHGEIAGSTPEVERVRRALIGALAIAIAFMALEIVGGLIANSLALLGDAAHMFTDSASYAIALYAAVLAARPPSKRRTWGNARAEILAALFNGATLIAASAWILLEALRRLFEPAQVAGATVIWIAMAGLLANIAMLGILWRARSHNLNLRGVFLHALADTASSVLVIASGAVVAITGFDRADAIASIAIALLVIRGSWHLVRSATDVLLDTVPPDVAIDEVANSIVAVTGVTEVHDLHVWALTPGATALSAHVRVRYGVDRDLVIAHLQELLRTSFGIGHTTLQVTTDLAAEPLAAVAPMDVADAVAWATDHIARAHPEFSRAVITAAAGAAVVGTKASQQISPVTLSARAMAILRADHASPM